MPHSGGGGSHSGGGGGGHSSGGSSTRVASAPFKGSHTYVVYDNTGASRLVYANSKDYHAEVTKKSLISNSIILTVFFAIPGFCVFVFGIISMITSLHFGMSKTDYPSRIDDTVYIFDDYDLVSDKEEQRLIETLEEFRDNTGVIPAVEFTYDDFWMGNYNGDMEPFAYNEYVTNFDDEYHLLVVYSYGYEDAQTGFNEFHWNAMWGNDLGKTIFSDDEVYFGDDLQKQFSIANGKNVSTAIETSVVNLYMRLTESFFRLDKGSLISGVGCLIWGLLFGGAGVAAVLSTISGYKKSKAKGEVTYKIKGTPQIGKCKYCECTYYLGTVGTCVHCGAPLDNKSYDV